MTTNVLLIEDSKTQALHMRHVLEAGGYAVNVSTSGVDGIKRARDTHPDVIVLDTLLLRMSGYEAWERLKADAATADIPVVLLTQEPVLSALPDGQALRCSNFVPECTVATDLVHKVAAVTKGPCSAARGGDADLAEMLGVGRISLKGDAIQAVDGLAAGLLGSTPESLQGTPLSEALDCADGSLRSFLSTAEKGNLAGAEFRVGTHGLSDGSGSRWCQFRAIQSNGTTELAVLDISEAATARKKAAELEEKLRAATSELEQAKRTRSDFLAMISHELRTPLHGILGMLDLANGTESGDEHDGYLREARQSAESMLNIVSDMVEFSEYRGGQAILSDEVCSLADVVAECVARVRPSAEAKDLVIETTLPQDVPDTAKADRRKLSRVLDLLLGNAVKFTESGQVLVTLALEESGAAQKLRFAVKDSGSGIAADQLDSVFDAFQQADTSTTRVYGGAGMGLAIAREIVTLMGGRIWVESEPGRGCCFSFTMPLGVTDGAQPAPVAARVVEEIPPLNILLAEDSKTNQLLGRANLSKAGHTVAIAKNGREAVDLFTQGTYDIILMDVSMPEMDGMEATRVIREMEQARGSHIPIIAMTAFALDEYRQKCLEAGMDVFVTKPVSADKVEEAMAPLLYMLSAEGPAAQEPESGAAPADLTAAMETVGYDTELLKAVVNMSLEEFPGLMEELRGAIAASDFNTGPRDCPGARNDGNERVPRRG